MVVADKLKRQVEQLRKAVGTLEEMFSLEQTAVTRDATIQRFEYTFELTWKVMQSRVLLEGKEAPSPRQAIQTARNYTVHTYDESVADWVYGQAKDFLPEVKRLVEKANELVWAGRSEKRLTFLGNPWKGKWS